MADPDSQAQLRAASAANGRALTGSVVANGRVSKRDSDEIVAEIERTRQSLARTIDTLADRVSPASNVKRLRERASEELAKPEVQLAAAAVALALTGIVIYRCSGGGVSPDWARSPGRPDCPDSRMALEEGLAFAAVGGHGGGDRVAVD